MINKSLLKYCKYCIVGAIGAITDFSVYIVLFKFIFLNYIIANALSITVALIIVYFFQKNWTFQYIPKNKSKTFHKYLISVIITYILNNGVLFFFVGIMGYDEIISKIDQIFLSTIWGYILSNFYVFTKKEEISDMDKFSL